MLPTTVMTCAVIIGYIEVIFDVDQTTSRLYCTVSIFQEECHCIRMSTKENDKEDDEEHSLEMCRLSGLECCRAVT